MSLKKAGFSNQRPHILSVFMVFFLLIVLALSFPKVQATDSSNILVWGQVTDAVTGQSIPDATIAVWEINTRWYEASDLIELLETDVNGSYRVSFEGTFKKQYEGSSHFYSVFYRVYAYHDDPSTPGYDYLPMFSDLMKGGEANIDFKMIPAASILLEDEEVLFVDSPRPPSEYVFTVMSREKLPDGCVVEYGEWSQSRFINASFNHVIIPANTDIQIEVKTLGIISKTGQDYHSFVMDDPKFFLGKGELTRVNVMQYSIPYNINIATSVIDLTETHIIEAEQKGLYTTAERQDLKMVWVLIESAEDKLIEGSYKASYADIREAYLKAVQIDGTIQRLYADAATSVYVIILFLAFTSTAISHIFFVHKNKQVLVTGILYIVFLTILFNVYYGSQIVEFPSLVGVAGLSIFTSTSIVLILPRVFPQRIAVTFSIAKRSLLRRKSRFILTLITIIVMVMGFVSLTSFTMEHGFISKTIGTLDIGSEGVLVREPLPRLPSLLGYDSPVMVATFTALEISDLEWLQRNPEVTLVSPKVENIAFRYPLGFLLTPVNKLSVYGVLGLSYNEVEISEFDNLLVEGRFLHDAEEDSILISVQAAKTLNVEVGEHLVLDIGGSTLELELVGLLDDNLLRQITDYDGSPIIPKKLIVSTEEGKVIEERIAPCDPSEVVILNWQTAMDLSSFILLSMIDVLLEDSVDPLIFSRQLALTRDFWIWTVVNERINFFGSMPYFEAKGLSIFVPWLIAIMTVVMTMINVIYERRDEVSILSSVGLNPTHITSIFGAEALIIGIIGGGVGYLLGQGSYKLASLLSMDILVEQKVSALWSFASLAIAITTVLVGAFIALKFSTIITPSLLRRWSVEGRGHFMGEPWILNIPFKVKEEELNSMFDYVIARFRRYLKSKGIDETIGAVKLVEDEKDGGSIRTVDFNYLLGERSKLGSFPFKLIAKREENEETYFLKVICKGPEDIVEETVSFLRMSIVEWSATKERKAKRFGLASSKTRKQ